MMCPPASRRSESVDGDTRSRPGRKLGWLRATQLAFDDPESGCVERADHLWSYDFVHHRADDDRAFSTTKPLAAIYRRRRE